MKIFIFCLLFLLNIESIALGQKIQSVYKKECFLKYIDKELSDSLLFPCFKKELDKINTPNEIYIEKFLAISIRFNKYGKMESVKILNKYGLDSFSMIICEKIFSRIRKRKHFNYPKNQFFVFKWFLFTRPLWNKYFEEDPSGEILKLSFDYRDLINIRTAETRKDAIVSPIRIVGRSTGLVGPGSEVSCN